MNKREFLAMNLPYDLEVAEFNDDGKLQRVHTLYGGNVNSFCMFNWYKPICRSLYDLNKPIEHKGETFVPIYRLLEEATKKWCINGLNCPSNSADLHSEIIANIDSCEFWVIKKLIEWHFNLMDEGEEFVDVNTLPENPYK